MREGGLERLHSSLEGILTAEESPPNKRVEAEPDVIDHERTDGGAKKHKAGAAHAAAGLNAFWVDVDDGDLQPMEQSPPARRNNNNAEDGHGREGLRPLMRPRHPETKHIPQRVALAEADEPRKPFQISQARAGRLAALQAGQPPEKQPYEDWIVLPQEDVPKPAVKYTKDLAEEYGIKLGGIPNAGYIPPEAHSVKLPATMRYEGLRDMQVLSQFSEIFHSRLPAEATETQFGYGQKRDGGLDVFASTNTADTQHQLTDLLANPAAVVRQVADDEHADEHLRSVANKLLFWKEQQEVRQAKIESQYAENDPRRAELLEDLQRSTAIRNQIMNVGGVNVVTNESLGPRGGLQDHNRHAEQNIAEALYRKDEQAGYQRAAIAGTKIRCEACCATLGSNLCTHHNGGIMDVTGLVYAPQATEAAHRAMFRDIQELRAGFRRESPDRPPSASPPASPPLSPRF